MKFTKTLLTATAFAASTSVSALPIDDLLSVFGPGSYLSIGTVYQDSTADGIPGTGSFDVRGIGRVDSISDADGVEVWTNGTSGLELNMVFDGFSFADEIFGPAFLTGVSGGSIDFYTGSVGTFGVSGDFLTDAAAILATDMFFESSAMVDAGNTMNGTVLGNSVDRILGEVFTNIDSALSPELLAALDSDAFMTDSGGADLSFSFSADNVNAAGYERSGSFDGRFERVPEPGTLALLSLGTLGMFGASRKKNS